MMGTDLARELTDALDAEGNAQDFNDYTLLDRLIYKSRSDEGVRSSLLDLLRTSITDIINQARDPQPLAALFVGLKIKDSDIADSLEAAITTGRFKDAYKRLAALQLLRASGRVLPPRYIVDDGEIRSFAPLQWLDLSLPVFPEPDARRSAILSLVESGALGPSEMHPRLQAIWSAGGPVPVDFLTGVLARMSAEKRPDFLEMVKQGFGVSLSISSASKAPDERNLRPQVQLSRRLKERVKQVSKSDEAQLKVHKIKVRKSAIVRPFQEFRLNSAAA